MPFPKFTEFQESEMQRVSREYVRERALHTSALTGNGDQLNFMRMCNAFGKRLADVMPQEITDTELQELYVTLDMPAGTNALGLPTDFPNFTPYDREACAELVGVVLGLRRMG